MEVVSIIANPPTTWEVTTLGKVCEEGGGDIQTGPFGSQLHASDYVNDGIPSVMPVNIGDSRILTDGICRITEADAQRLSRYRLRAGDIVYSRRGDVERLALVRDKEDGWLCGTGCLRARFGKNKVNPLYASYYLGHPSVRQWVVQHAIGATMPNLNTGILSALPFLCPPLPVQHRIADILGSLDDKIELNRRTNETLETMARTIYKSWFVDFDPVVAKSEGRQPEGMDAETAKLFPSSFEDSEIGRVPKGWKVAKIGDSVTVVGGATPSTTNPSFWNGAHCFCTPKDLAKVSSPVLLDTERKLSDIGVKQVGSGLLPAGTVLLSSRAPIGYFVLTEVPTTINQGFIAMICDKVLPNLYVLRWVETNMDAIKGRANGTTFMEVSKAAFRPIQVIVPSPETLIAFCKVIEPLHARVVSNLKENACLARARDSLLPRLLSGELVVPTSKVV